MPIGLRIQSIEQVEEQVPVGLRIQSIEQVGD